MNVLAGFQFQILVSYVWFASQFVNFECRICCKILNWFKSFTFCRCVEWFELCPCGAVCVLCLYLSMCPRVIWFVVFSVCVRVY